MHEPGHSAYSFTEFWLVLVVILVKIHGSNCVSAKSSVEFIIVVG